MFFKDEELIKILTENNLVTAEKIRAASLQAKQDKVTLAAELVKQGMVSEEVLAEHYAETSKVPYVNLEKKKIPKEVLLSIPEPIARNYQVVAFEKDKEKLKLAMVDPTDLQTIEFMEKKTGMKIEVFLTTPTSISEVLKQYRKSLKTEFSEIIDKQGIREPEDAEDLRKMAKELPVVKIVDTLLEYAIYENASDIHIEPLEGEIVVRYRVDGVLRDVMSLPKKILAGVVARIKVLSDLKIDEHRLPQDGRFKIENEEYKISFRVSVIPVFNGEKIVMRLLFESAKPFTMEEMGLRLNALKIVKLNINRPHGMILSTGPTGSGKTTTLYSILNILNTPEVNICTIEDPIEYHMPRINQSQVAPKIGYTFANGLRSLLRQDPDIIMVGEIRDSETAEMAIHSSLTGHLVLSTLHTNNAAGAIPRLIDMKIEPFLLASTLNVIIAQRLVRKICSNCIESFHLDRAAWQNLESEVNLKKILEIMVREGAIVSSKITPDSLLFYRGRGCAQCNNTGYKGRLGIFEVLEVSEAIQSLATKRAPTEEIEKQAISEGMTRMIEDGFYKAKMGVTTLEEVLRVTKE
ncbi:MAG: GspE/PulE family protein [Patescibacteria group bacterium]|nr:GspE/PulE family protein [Patescibacteria group bacterium]